ncbi:hypothetical protein CALVIDRAFT_563088 [Calocera viscosa TUFC12733]|uniref:Uncharacterized protein n=1 Tax=Calocera viscosa (strain TUFC12733) TaxID=1330018 RepID=A0A167N317_CALVF|nr:hypothetical protein CALVIDRAFT_563088 [Calocera viscosa TUFC12733]
MSAWPAPRPLEHEHQVLSLLGVQTLVTVKMTDICKTIVEIFSGTRMINDMDIAPIPTEKRDVWDHVMNACIVFYHYTCMSDSMPFILKQQIRAVLRSSSNAMAKEGIPPHLAIGIDLHWLPPDMFAKWIPGVDWEYTARPQGIDSEDGTLTGLQFVASDGVSQAFQVDWYQRLVILHGELFGSLLDACSPYPALHVDNWPQAKSSLSLIRRVWDLADEAAQRLCIGAYAAQLEARLLRDVLYARDARWAFQRDISDSLLSSPWLPPHLLDFALGRQPSLCNLPAASQSATSVGGDWWRRLDGAETPSLIARIEMEFGPMLLSTLLPEGSWHEPDDPRTAHWYLQSRIDPWINFFLRCFVVGVTPSDSMIMALEHFTTNTAVLFSDRDPQRCIPIDVVPVRVLSRTCLRFCAREPNLPLHRPALLKADVWLERFEPIAASLKEQLPLPTKFTHMRDACEHLGILFASFGQEALERSSPRLQRLAMELLNQAHLCAAKESSLIQHLPDIRRIPPFWLRNMALACGLINATTIAREIQEQLQQDQHLLNPVGNTQQAIITQRSAAVKPVHISEDVDMDADSLQFEEEPQHNIGMTDVELQPRNEDHAPPAVTSGDIDIDMDADDMLPAPYVSDSVPSGAPRTEVQHPRSGWSPDHASSSESKSPENVHQNRSKSAAERDDAQQNSNAAQPEPVAKKVAPRPDAGQASKKKPLPTVIVIKLTTTASLKAGKKDPIRDDPDFRAYYASGPWNVPNTGMALEAIKIDTKLPTYTPTLGKKGWRRFEPFVLSPSAAENLAALVRQHGMVVLGWSNGLIIEITHGIYRCQTCQQMWPSTIAQSEWWEFCWRVWGGTCGPCSIRNKGCRHRTADCRDVPPSVYDVPYKQRKPTKLPTSDMTLLILGPLLGIKVPLPLSKNAKQQAKRKEKEEAAKLKGQSKGSTDLEEEVRQQGDVHQRPSRRGQARKKAESEDDAMEEDDRDEAESLYEDSTDRDDSDYEDTGYV